VTAFLVAHEGWLRLAAFAGVLAVMLGWEWLRPLRPGPHRGRRWTANLGLAAVDSVLLRLLLPGAAVGAALWANVNGFGLFNATALTGAVGNAVAFAASFVLLDLAVWAQHVATHKVPLLWRLHRVHHSDVQFDTTTGLRFHPIEIVISMLYKVAVVVALGAPVAAVVAFEIVLNASSLFNHGNVRLPARLDAALRWVIVTPDFHRIHHSVRREETDSNFGFFFSFWDRLFATYQARSKDGTAGMTIGLAEWREDGAQRLPALLLQPFGIRSRRP